MSDTTPQNETPISVTADDLHDEVYADLYGDTYTPTSEREA
ncbi:hypothetical protein ACWGII_39735 [Streptomyces sp. NPDC054855]